MGLRKRKWKGRYDRSRINRDGTVPDLLNDFYIPALSEAVAYDRESGYFKASSLSVAARGVAPFFANGGKMRLISGTQWEPAYTKLILSDPSRLEQALAEVLDTQKWSEAEKEGMLWLCHLLREGRLEVRLALRVRGDGDGYFHNKHGLLTDADGDRIAFEGSVNETANGWVENSEFIHVLCSWENLSENERANFAEIEHGFNLLWEDRHPDFKVRTLPEAITERMIAISERFPPVRPDDALVPPPDMEEEIGAGVTGDHDFTDLDAMLAAPAGSEHPFVGATLLPLTLWPHQEVAVWRLVSEYPRGFLLADEVGLGKTIETAAAARALWAQGKVKRILITAPASLCEQWLREMAEKFHMPFHLFQQGKHLRLWPDEETVAGKSIFGPDLVIVSHGLLRHSNRRDALETMEPFDLVIVDEAHYLRRSNPDPLNNPAVEVAPEYGKLYKAVEDFLVAKEKSKCLWLATATPVQLNFVEAWDLLRLLRRTGEFDADVALSAQWYDWIERLQNGQSLAREWPYVRAIVSRLRTIDSDYHHWLTHHFLPRHRHRFLDQDWNERIVRNERLREEVVQLLFYLAPLSRVMIRHSRRLLEVYRKEKFLAAGLAQREIVSRPPIQRTPEETEVEAALRAYCEGLSEQINAAQTSQQGKLLRTTLGFYLSFLRLRGASSLRALDRSLQNRLARVEATLRHELTEDEDESEDEDFITGSGEDDANHRVFLNNRSEADLRWEARKITELRKRLTPLLRRAQDTKQEALMRILEERREPNGRVRQIVVFTRFLDTLWDVWNRLQPLGLHVGVFCGKGGFLLRNGRKHEIGRPGIKEAFIEGRVDVLLCTDAAAEGLNLQVADTLVNLDMPWGPMKVEQRIGRIDRIGQKHAFVYIHNLRYKDSVEDIVYERLFQRLRRAISTVGHYSFSILPLNEEDFSKVDTGEWSEEQLRQEAERRLQQQMRFTELRTFGPEEVFQIHQKLRRKNPLVREPWTSRRAARVVSRLAGFFLKDGDAWQIGGKRFGFEVKAGLGVLAPRTPAWEQLCEMRGAQAEPAPRATVQEDKAAFRRQTRYSGDLQESAEALMRMYSRAHPDKEPKKLIDLIEQHLERGIQVPEAAADFRELNTVNGRWVVAALRRKHSRRK